MQSALHTSLWIWGPVASGPLTKRYGASTAYCGRELRVAVPTTTRTDTDHKLRTLLFITLWHFFRGHSPVVSIISVNSVYTPPPSVGWKHQGHFFVIAPLTAWKIMRGKCFLLNVSRVQHFGVVLFLHFTKTIFKLQGCPSKRISLSMAR